MKVYLFRHGETEWSLNGRHTSFTDLPLTAKGRKEAECLRSDLQFDFVYCSPLLRAVDTCKLAGYEHCMQIEPNLVEWNYGQYEGLTTEEIQKKDPGWTIFSGKTPGGENPLQIKKRADSVLKKLKGKRVALFSSGHFSRVLTARWLGYEVSEGKHFELSTASKSILSFEHNIPTILLWNDTSHLNRLE